MLNLRQPMRILLADDDPDEAEFFEGALRATGIYYQFVAVKDGNELIRYLSGCTDLPHILFLDLNMPKMNGMEALKAIRADPRYARLVVAVYSTSSHRDDRDGTLSNGANCYIVKPHNLTALKDTVVHVLRLQWQFHLCNMSIENFVISV